MAIKTEIEELAKDKILLKVEVPVEQLSVAIKRAYNTMANHMNLPGFRKGKVPHHLIDQRIGKENVLQEVVNSSIPLFYKEALKIAQVDPIDRAEIDVKQLEDDKPLLFEAKVPVVPTPVLCDYKDIVIDAPQIVVTEEDIDGQIETLRTKFARFVPVTDRPVKDKDLVLIDIEAFIQGQNRPIKGGVQNDYLLEVGNNQIGLDIEMKIVGTKISETAEIPIEMPEDFSNRDIAGKTVVYKITVKDIKERVLPEINDELAQNISEFETFKELKNDIQDKLIEDKQKKAQEKADQTAMEMILKESTVDVPEVMIEDRVDHMMKLFEDTLRSRNLSVEEYLEQTKLTLNDLKRDYEKSATEHLKTDIVLKAVAKVEGLNVEDEDIDKELKTYASSQGKTLEAVKNDFESRGQLGQIKDNILASRALEFISKSVTVHYVEASASDAKEKKLKVPKITIKAPVEKKSEKTEKETENA